MLNRVSFTCTALKGYNKVGLIKPDEQGYYRVVLGALSAYNSNGDLYTWTPEVKALFDRSGSLMRRVERGALRAENGHPKMEVGMSRNDYARRIMQIYEDRVCAHIKQVDLVFDKYKDNRGKPIIAIEGLVAPAGELAHVLERALKNPNENIAFSIRSFTEDVPSFTGTLVKNLVNIITWDYVGEPGIPQAEKYYSPSLESLEETKFSRSTLEQAYYKDSEGNIGMESARMNIDELFRSLGWSNSNESKPKYLDW